MEPLGVYGQATISPNNLPVVRSYKTLTPMQMNVVNFNRSEVIRQLFLRMGDADDGFVLDYLRGQGMSCSRSLIQQIRKGSQRKGLI